MLDAILDFSARHHLCRQFHIIRTMRNILVYNKFCYTGGPGPEIFLALIVNHPKWTNESSVISFNIERMTSVQKLIFYKMLWLPGVDNMKIDKNANK